MEPAISSTKALLQTWDANWTGLGSDDAQAKLISDGIEDVRRDVLTVISMLD